MGVALSDELRKKLEAASTAAGHSIAEEIRLRLERTFQVDTYDAATRELAADVLWIADEINRQSVSWHLYPKAREALTEAIRTWIEITAPKRKIKMPQPGRMVPVPGVSDLFGPDDPATLGRSIARLYERVKPELEKNTQELLKLHREDKS
jgi:hypothetical protein